MAGDNATVVRLAKALVKGLKADSIEDVGVNTVPQVVAGGKTPLKFRAESNLQKERGEILRALKEAGISQTVARAVVLMHRKAPLTPKIGVGQVQQAMVRTNLIRRAQFLLNAARRMQREADELRSQPGASKLSVAKAIVRAVQVESRYYDLHLRASHERELKASAVDIQAAQHGDELGWYAVVDSRTSRDCLQANGKNFYVGKPPGIGWPGAVHPTCRCVSGPPHKTNKTVYGVRGH